MTANRARSDQLPLAAVAVGSEILLSKERVVSTSIAAKLTMHLLWPRTHARHEVALSRR